MANNIYGSQAAHTKANYMSREDYLKKYGTTFVADDRGGNAASEVAGQDVGEYYDNYLDPNSTRTKTTWDAGSQEYKTTGMGEGVSWDRGAHRDNLPYFDAWDNANPHPESQRGTGWEEGWRQVGRPIATAAAMYFGAGALNGAMGGATGAGVGGSTAGGGALGAAADFGAGTYGAGLGAGEAAGLAAGAAPTASSAFNFAVPEALGSSAALDVGAIGTTGAASTAAPMTLAEQYAAYGAGGGGVTGGISGGVPGTFTGAAGGDLVGQAAASGGGGLMQNLKDGASWLTDKNSLGGLMTPLQGISGLYDMWASGKKSDAMSNRYDQMNSAINNYGAPGSAEYEMMKQELARKDAASGRNSQYGPRAVDLAARMAQPRMNAMIAAQTGQNNLLNQQQNQQYSGLNSLFSSMGQSSGNSSIMNSLSDWLKTRQQQTGT